MNDTENSKRKRVRSPAYPSISLEEAIKKAQAIYDAERRHSFPMDVAIRHCGYEPNNSVGQRAVAALKHFGLVNESSTPEGRQGRLTEIARDIILVDEESLETATKALQEAALSPRIHRTLWDEYGGELPSDGSLRTFLIRRENFNDGVVDDFIKQFRETVSFAKLSSSDIIDSETPPNDDGIDQDADRGDDKQGHGGAPLKKRRERQQMEIGVKEATYPMATGDVVLTWPDRISPDEAEDLDDWLDIMKRKLRRSVVEETDSPDESS